MKRLVIVVAAFVVVGCGFGDKFKGSSQSQTGDDMQHGQADMNTLSPSPDLAPLPLGQASPCGNDSQCASQHCVDGVCCESACNAACKTCALPGSVGQCVNSAATMPDPHAMCPMDAATCGHDGTCDGNGNCAEAPPTKVCAPQSCSNGVLSMARTCDGMGSCGNLTTRTCAPYVCLTDGSDCYETCSGTSTGCESPNVCNAGTCGKAANGAQCSNGSTCQSSYCVSGRCCGSASCGTCYSCAVTGHEGACYPVAVNTSDPGCPVDAASTCGHNGTCNGSGACGYYPMGVECLAPYCDSSGDAVTEHSYCPGGGQACPTNVGISLQHCTAPQTCQPSGIGDGVTCK